MAGMEFVESPDIRNGKCEDQAVEYTVADGGAVAIRRGAEASGAGEAEEVFGP